MTVELTSGMPTMVHDSSHLPPTESAMTVGLAFRHVSDDTSQCLLTLYKESNDGGVSLPACQQLYISVPTYLLQKVRRPRGYPSDLLTPVHLSVHLPSTKIQYRRC